MTGPALLAGLAVAAGVTAQSITGFGFSLVCAPFLVAAYRAPTGIQLNLVLSALVNVAVLVREHEHADRRAATLLLLPALVAVLPAAWLAHHTGSGPLTIAAGAACLVAVAALAAGTHLPRLSGRTGTITVGLLSGATNVIAGISGPPVVIFAVNNDWPAVQVRPTLQLFFLGLNILTIASLGLPTHLPAAPVAGFLAGLLAARIIGHRPSPEAVRRATLLLAALGSAVAIGRGLTT